MISQVGEVSALPSKRIYHSIIADYDLKMAICELIDNAIDLWLRDGKQNALTIHIDMNLDQQMIAVSDNSGGIKEGDLNLVVAPGATTNKGEDEIIGFFGVGTKRAVVALAQEVKITTRYADGPCYEVRLDDSWLETDDWDLPYFRVADISPGTTRITLQRLRSPITEKIITIVRDHLGATYARFLNDSEVSIFVNSSLVVPREFENWSYPPNYEPRLYKSVLTMPEGDSVRVEVLAGLVNESSPTGGEYGVYVYCNDRLICRGLKNLDVGFSKGLAGQPHPSVSIMRVLVSLKGPAELMPWNSTKSNINANHRTFVALRDWLVQIVKEFASLARRLEGEWPEKVFQYASGTIIEHDIANIRTSRRSYLPPLPAARPRIGDRLAALNRSVIAEKPWTTGLEESIVAVNIISKLKLKQKNRINLILLDSTLEIAFKEFLVYESGEQYSETRLQNLFKNRVEVQQEVERHTSFPDDVWKKISFYYGLRTKLVHEKASAGITDEELEDYLSVVERVLEDLFGLRFDA